MSSAASLLQGQGTHRTAAPVRLPLEVLKRRVGQRRQMLAVQGVSYALITSVLLVYCYAGTIPIIIPSAYFLSGIGLVSVFVVLSEAHFNDRFEDHYLTIFQVAGHVALQLCFLLAAPEIGFAFLSVVFLIFGFGALRMTSRQAIISWTLTMIGLAPIFLFSSTPIGLPITHPDRTRRGHAFLCPHDRTVRLRGAVWQHHAQDALRPQLRTEGGLQADRGACRTRRTDGGVQPPLHHANAGGGDRPRDPQRIALLHRADRPRLVQAHQRRLRPSDRRRGAADILDHHVRQHPQRRPVRPLWRRGIPAGAARHGRRPGHAGARPVARHYCRSRLERVLAGHEGDDVGRRCNAQSERDVRHYFSRAPTARFMQPRRRDATALPAPDPTYFSSGGGESAAGFCSRTES